MTKIDPHQNLELHPLSWVRTDLELADRPTVQDGLHVDTCLIESWAYGDVNRRALQRVEDILASGVTVTLSEGQLDALADRIAAQLSTPWFTAR